MAYDGLITSFLGQGLAAARPASLTIHPEAIGFYWATDTDELSMWAEGAWVTDVLSTDDYEPGGIDVALADGGTGASLADPNADRIFFWDDSAGATTWLEVGSGLSITGTTLSASGAAYSPTVVSSQSGTSYTAVIGDANGYIRFTNGSPVTFTIPPNSSVAFPVDTVIEMEQAGAGALTVAAGSGVTINSRGTDLTLAGQYGVAALKKVATDTWTLTGDL